MVNFAQLCFGALCRPGVTFRYLAQFRHWRYAWGVVWIYIGLYYLLNIYRMVNQLQPAYPALLATSAGRDYTWQLLAGLPVVIAGWWLYAVTAWFTGQRLGGSGTLKGMAHSTAFSFFLPLIPTIWLLQAALVLLAPRPWSSAMPLAAPWNSLFWIVTFLAIGWSLLTGTIAAREVLALRAWKAFLASLAGAVAALGLFFLYLSV